MKEKRGCGIADMPSATSPDEVASRRSPTCCSSATSPATTELEEFSASWFAIVGNPSRYHFVESLTSGMHPMDVLRTGISLLGLHDPDAQDGSARRTFANR